jgi:hypothetical protein
MEKVDWRRVVSAACLKCDWTALARTALGSPELAAMVGEAFRMIGASIEQDIARADAPPSPPATAIPVEEPTRDEPAEPDPAPASIVDERVANAATLLGVAPDATEDEIRAALRSRLSSSRLHPDHGGDGDEAKQLIAAKNLLIERAKAARI